MNDIDQALKDIAAIKEHISQNRSFQGLGAQALAVTAILPLILGWYQHVFPRAYPQFITEWLILGAMCAVVLGIETARRAVLYHNVSAWSRTENFAWHFIPSIAVGGVLSVGLMLKPEGLWLLPVIWLGLLAIGAFSAAKDLAKNFEIVSGWYLLATIGFLMLCNAQSPSPIILAIILSIGQGLAALIMYKDQS